MFLFLLGSRIYYDFQDPGCQTIVNEQVENHPKNADELKNHISSVLSASGKADTFAKKAQVGNVRKVVYNLVSTNYYNKRETPKILYRTFSLKTTFISSSKNSDGSFNVKHYTVTSTKELRLVFDSIQGVFIHPKIPTMYFVYYKNGSPGWGDLAGLKGYEVTNYCNQLIEATNTQRAKIIEWFNSK